MTAISLGLAARPTRLGMRAITAAIKVGPLETAEDIWLAPVQLREQFEMGNVASLRRKNLPVGSSISSWASGARHTR